MMTIDEKTFFTALGFFAVIIRDVPQDKQAIRASAIAKLIEDFCATSAAEQQAAEACTKDAGVVMSQMFSKLINDNQKNDRLRDAMQALEHCLHADVIDTVAATSSGDQHILT